MQALDSKESENEMKNCNLVDTKIVGKRGLKHP